MSWNTWSDTVSNILSFNAGILTGIAIMVLAGMVFEVKDNDDDDKGDE